MHTPFDKPLSGVADAAALAAMSLRLRATHKLWDRGQHNAFTDLCAFRDQCWLVFREASNHVSDDGVIIVLSDRGTGNWHRVTTLALSGIDLRDPKITVTPDRRLLITCAGVLCKRDERPHQSFLFWSADGCAWTEPQPVGRLHDWIWRTRFFGDDGYGVAYRAAAQTTTLYRLRGGDYAVWLDPLFSRASHGLGYPNEHDLFALDDVSMGCLLRRDADTATAQLGIARAPYREWQWRDLGVRIGGPVVLPLRVSGGGRAWLAAVRLYDPVRTALCWLDVNAASLTEIVTLPSGGDTSYAGLLQRGDDILCSYYSSHEQKTAIYLAQLTLALAAGND